MYPSGGRPGPLDRMFRVSVLFHQPEHEPGPVPAVVFVADNVKSTYEELKAKGIEFTQPPKKEVWDEHAIFKDSEGNLVLFGTS